MSRCRARSSREPIAPRRGPAGPDAGRGVVALLTRWGGDPLLERMMVRVVVRRYRALVPDMLVVNLIGQVLRMVIRRHTPVVGAHPAGSGEYAGSCCRSPRRCGSGR